MFNNGFKFPAYVKAEYKFLVGICQAKKYRNLMFMIC